MRKSRYRDTLFSVILLTSSCALNPVTGKNDFVTISESNEIAQGAQYHESIIEQYGVYDNPLLQTYVNDIGQALARKKP